MNAPVQAGPRAYCEELEPRILFDASSPAALVASSAAGAPAVAVAPVAVATAQPSQVAHELVVVDARSPDLAGLLADFDAQAAAGRPLSVLVVQAEDGGLAAVSALLAASPGEYAAVHLIGHGEPGALVLGADRLDLATLRERGAEIAGWSAGLAAGADLLLYGCDVAADAAGRQLVDALHALTGADVAASVDATGSAALGGDWVLEDQVGDVNSRLAVSIAEQAAYGALLGLVPAGPAVPVDAGQADQQALATQSSGRQVATNAAGTTVAVWEDTNAHVIMARRFDASGSPIGAAFQVNTSTGASPTTPVVAIDASGAFVVAWSSTGQDGNGKGIQARFYDASGNAVTGEVRVNTTTGRDQFDPAIAIGSGGDVVFTWTTTYPLKSTTDISYRRFDLSGSAQDALEVPVTNVLQFVDHSKSSVAIGSGGQMVVTWQQANGGNWDVYAQRYGSPGSATGGAILVTPSVVGGTLVPDVAVGAGGEFMVAWTADIPSSRTDVHGRFFNADGSARTGVLTLNANVHQADANPAVAPLAGGGYVVSWISKGQIDSHFDVFTAQFDASGVALTGDTLVNAYTDGDQGWPGVASAGTRVVYLWGGKGPDGDAEVMLRSFSVVTPGFAVTPASPAAVSEAGGQTSFTVALTSPPMSDVTVALTLSDPTAATLSTASLTFTAGNWNTAQTVTVTGRRDALYTGDRVLQVLFGTAVSADAGYAGQVAAPVSFTLSEVDTYSQLVVDTAADLVDGDTTDAASLLRDPGADGHVSLREAILALNASADGPGGASRILFALPGSGVRTIALSSALPTITASLMIDGFSQAGAVQGGTAFGQGNTLLVRLDGAAAGAAADGLVIRGDGSAVLGLVIGGFGGSGIVVDAADVLVAGNRIGTTASGATAQPNGGDGLRIDADDVVVGGAVGWMANQIAGNGGSGIHVGTSAGVTISGNLVGTTADGMAALGNGGDGIAIDAGASATQVGGTAAGSTNVIAGNGGSGVSVNGAVGAVVQGNLIGRNALDTATLGNLGDGVRITAGATSTLIGGVSAGSANTLAGNGIGVAVLSGSSNAILGNTLYDNRALGIDLGGDGVTAIQANPPGAGPNLYQNPPELTQAIPSSGTVAIAGTLRAAASTAFRVEFYADAAPDASGHGEGRTYLGFVDVTTDAAGQATIAWAYGAALAVGTPVTATATRASPGFASYFDTSEFAANLPVDTPPVFASPASFAVPENTTAVGTVTAGDADGQAVVYAIVGGDDAARFAIDAATGALRFVAAPDFEAPGDANADGVYALVVRATDTLGAATDQSIDVTVENVNEAPAIMFPASVSVPQESRLALSAADGRAIEVSDVDAGPQPVQVTLGVAHGTLTLASTAGLAFTAGSGGADATLVFRGTIADVNAALDGLVYAPTIGFAGADSLSVVVDDLGHSGSGGARVASGAVAIDVSAVDHPPTLSVPGPQGVPANGVLVLAAGNGNAIDVSDPDAAQGPLTVRLAASGGTLVLAGDAGLSYVAGGGGGGPVLAVTGSLADLRAALASVRYVPDADATGTFTIDVSVTDAADATKTAAAQIVVTVQAAPVAPAGTSSDGAPGIAPPVASRTASAAAATTSSADSQASTDTATTSTAATAAAPAAPGAVAGAQPGPRGQTGRATDAARDTFVAPVPPAARSGAARLADEAQLRDTGIVPGTAPAGPASRIDLRADWQPAVQDRQARLSFADAPSLARADDRRALVQSLDAVRERLDGRLHFDRDLVAASATASAGLSIGYVVWLLRGGVLLSSMLASVPAWATFDPLPVLDRSGRQADDGDDESLEDMLRRSRNGSPEPAPDGDGSPGGEAGDPGRVAGGASRET